MSHVGTMIAISGTIRFERKHFNVGEILAIVPVASVSHFPTMDAYWSVTVHYASAFKMRT